MPLGFPSDDAMDEALALHTAEEFIDPNKCEKYYIESDAEPSEPVTRAVFGFGDTCPLPTAKPGDICKAYKFKAARWQEPRVRGLRSELFGEARV